MFLYCTKVQQRLKIPVFHDDQHGIVIICTEPKVALLTHSRFGSSNCLAAREMHRTLELVKQMALQLEIDGEMHGDAALVESIRQDKMPNSSLK